MWFIHSPCIVCLLVEVYDANPDIRDNKGCTPLHEACLASDLNIVAFLLGLCSKVKRFRDGDVYSNGILHKACQSGNVAIMRYLVAHIDWDPCSTCRLNLYQDSVISYQLESTNAWTIPASEELSALVAPSSSSTQRAWSGTGTIYTGEIGIACRGWCNWADFTEISKFPEILGEPSMLKQCVPGSFFAAHALEPGNEALNAVMWSKYHRTGLNCENLVIANCEFF